MEHKYLSRRYWADSSTEMSGMDAASRKYDDIINMSIGDPDMTTPELIIERAFADAKAGHTGYTAFRGSKELRDEIVKFYREEYGLTIDDSEVFVSTSGCIAMALAMEAILNDGDEVIVPSPYFTPYKGQIQLARGVLVELPTYESEEFQIDAERLEAAITEKTRAIILNTPNNPTGACLKPETMEKIAAVVAKHDLIVVADEIYTMFSFQHEFVPFISLPGMRERTITINSFSKNFAMTGWRIGNIIAPDYLIETIMNINEGLAFTAPSISQRAAIAALQNRKTVQPPITKEFRERIYYAAERINRLKNMHVIDPPMGSIYLFPSIKDTGLTSKEAADRILNEAHVLMIPGSGFGRAGEGHLRICATISVEKIREAFNRIEKMAIFR